MNRAASFFCKRFAITTSLISVLATNCALGNQLYVTATELNGRANPNKHARVECYFSYGESVETTGSVSRDGKWVEVYGGETGTVWCSIDYLSETNGNSEYVNISGGRVRIRKTPDGKSVDWVKTNDTVTISRIVNGWGYIKNKGWVDLNYFSQIESE